MEEKRLGGVRWEVGLDRRGKKYGGCYHQGSEDEKGRREAGGGGFLIYVFLRIFISSQVQR